MADFENIPIDKSAEDFNYMHPVLWLNKKPTDSTVGKLKQLAIFDDIINKKRQIYYCGNVGNNYYNWQLCAETNISDGDSPSVDLSGYLKKDAISFTVDENSTDEQIPSAKAVYDLFNSITNGNEVAY